MFKKGYNVKIIFIAIGLTLLLNSICFALRLPIDPEATGERLTKLKESKIIGDIQKVLSEIDAKLDNPERYNQEQRSLWVAESIFYDYIQDGIRKKLYNISSEIEWYKLHKDYQLNIDTLIRNFDVVSEIIRYFIKNKDKINSLKNDAKMGENVAYICEHTDFLPAGVSVADLDSVGSEEMKQVITNFVSDIKVFYEDLSKNFKELKGPIQEILSIREFAKKLLEEDYPELKKAYVEYFEHYSNNTEEVKAKEEDFRIQYRIVREKIQDFQNRHKFNIDKNSENYLHESISFPLHGISLCLVTLPYKLGFKKNRLTKSIKEKFENIDKGIQEFKINLSILSTIENIPVGLDNYKDFLLQCRSAQVNM